MKIIVIAAVLAGQLMTAAAPAYAAELASDGGQQFGAFGGLRVNVPLERRSEGGAVRAGLLLAPTMGSTRGHGEVRTRIGEGLELGISGRDPVLLRLAGTPIGQLRNSRQGLPGDRRLGVSTLGWVGIGVGAVALLLGATYLALEDITDCDPGDDCS